MNTRNIVEKISAWMSVTGVLAGVIVAILSYNIKLRRNEHIQLATIEQSKELTQKVNQQIENLQKEIESSIAERKTNTESLDKLKNKIDQIKEEQQKILILASVQKMDPKLQTKFIESVSNRVQLNLSSSIKSNVEGIKKRLEELEALIVSGPIKALSIPLLRRAIGELDQKVSLINGKTEKINQILLVNASLKAQIQSLKEQLSQLNNWMIGIFGALGVSVIGLVINNIILHKKSYKNEKL